VPAKADKSKAYQTQLFSCWKINGFDSDKCLPIVRLMMSENKNYFDYQQKLGDLKLKTEIKNKLNKPLYPYLTKGRYRDIAPRMLNIYDGII